MSLQLAHDHFPSSVLSPSNGNVLSANGCVDGLSITLATLKMPKNKPRPPKRYAAASAGLTMLGGTWSSAGSGWASPQSHVS